MKAGRSYEGNGYEHYFDFGDAFMGISSCEKVITNAQGYTVVNNDIEKVTEKYVDLTYFYNTTWWILTSFTEAGTQESRKVSC